MADLSVSSPGNVPIGKTPTIRSARRYRWRSMSIGNSVSGHQPFPKSHHMPVDATLSAKVVILSRRCQLPDQTGQNRDHRQWSSLYL
jgi:hypothetical protein